ncbi:MAG TPA: ABC transporter permease subunit [Planctomycetota bacterium]|nr:ABC transporter permease subunit [Planctomycetota bacterium]
MSKPSFTGFQRQRTSSRLVRFGDLAARACITFGGMATIAAVTLVCGFLVWVAMPLLSGADLEPTPAVETEPPTAEARIAHQELDPYQQLVWQLRSDGNVLAMALADGRLVADARAYDAKTQKLLAVHDGRIAFTGPDRKVELADVVIGVADVAAGDVPAPLRELAMGKGARDGSSWVERTPAGFRRHSLRIKHGEPMQVAPEPVLRLDFAETNQGERIAAITENGQLLVRAISQRTNQMTDEVVTTVVGGDIALSALGIGNSEPDHLLLAGAGDNVYLLWNDGRFARIDARDCEALSLAETLDLVQEPEVRITALDFLVGRNTLLVGDDNGRVRSFFRTKPPNATGRDGAQLVAAHEFPGPGVAVRDIAASSRSRVFVCGYADNSLRVFHATSERLVASASLPETEGLVAVSMAPKEDGLLATTTVALHHFTFDPGHPEVTLAAVASPVWYEGYAKPVHAWQSTSGTDDVEPKFGLWPLVFGTLKATLYCMLFGVPLALLAAIYTSEFLHPRRRARIKPVVELMASLPSVVLGFLAALVFAPWVEDNLLTLLACFATVPFTWLLLAQATQALPQSRRLGAERMRLAGIALTVPIGIGLGWLTGRFAESVLFGGDFQLWLTRGHDGAAKPASDSAFGGWFVATLPVVSLLAAACVGRTRLFADRATGGVSRLLLGTGAALLFAALVAGTLTLSGFDLRGSLVSTYVQRNALVVGFVMGFAVIPIIYTITEDALSAVPEHLRAASLGAGATPWQTAVRIILPTAMSGVFSAVMVGLGRAVGETMIVLMAAGNTALLDINPFNGFRTLSANLAVELPEAVRDSSHYRVLYLAALVLFAMTFVLNTFAEVVRQRFRRRAWQL